MKKEICQRVGEYVVRFRDDDLNTLSVAKVADHFGVGRSYLLRVFKDYMRGDLEQFIIQKKISRAAVFWEKDLTLTAKEVAFRVGIPELSRFNELFMDYFGIDPEGFVHQLRGEFPPREFH
ncbi:MAG: helix-turn-helix domain-containing protein [bacterium]|nr:helix-turn-helix domain-containing protein [bacterium]